ncbi:MAG: gliding motility-associated C-terminal domain-containing protein [Saprospiraceae bacterium]|nr:gliding motility-associated C-terminal domain-containing protein [Saprospiraceae bacterium]MCB9320365.1 gliding motility-associated C-terminal domain-containing protein [Lewinellaceae bacterium]
MRNALTLLLLGIFYFIQSPLVSAADYYWVGGAGNWSDITHWRTTSGGNTQHNVVPSGADNVFFDANSFTGASQTITIDAPNVYCRDMDWTGATGNPRISGTALQAINISGSLNLIINMQFNHLGDVSFTGNEGGLTINMAGFRVRKNLNFKGGSLSTWTLASTLAIDSTLTCTGGSLNTADFGIEAGYLELMPLVQSTWSLGASHIVITQNGRLLQNYYYRYAAQIMGDFLTTQPGTSVLELSGDHTDLIATSSSRVFLNEVFFSSTSGSGYLSYRRDGYSTSLGPFDLNVLRYNNNGAIGFDGNSFGTLRLNAGKAYRFEAGTKTDIGMLDIMATCAQPVTIQSTTPNNPAQWRIGSNQSLSYLNVQGIQVTGGSITADMSSDLGSNSGWQFTNLASSTLYWVGGTGNWSDPMHWSGTSGGAGGSCIPSAGDVVVFDENSFSTNNNRVTLDLEGAVCGEMIWRNITRTPRLAGLVSNRLHIFGSMTLHQNMVWEFAGDLYLEGKASGLTVTSAGKQFLRDVFKTSPGEYTMQDSFSLLRKFHFVAGTWRTNNFDWHLNALDAEYTPARALYLGSSLVTLRTNIYQAQALEWRLYGDDFTLDAGTSTLFFKNFYSYIYHHFEQTKTLSYYKIRVNDGVYASMDMYPGNQGNSEIDIRSCYFGGDGNVFQNHRFGTLQLSAGYIYKFGNSGQVIYMDTLLANGRCDAMVRIESSVEGRAVQFSSPNNQRIQYAIIQNIQFQGNPLDHVADFSIGVGATPGWTIQELTKGRDLYWVGGTGIWHDPAHWSLTSGGPGGECIPTPFDNVFFDDQSFTGPNQQVSYAPQNYVVNFKNLLWSGPPASTTMTMDDMHAYGSFELRTDLTLYMNELYLKGDLQDNVLDMRNHFIWNLIIEGTGKWTMLSDFNFGYIGHQNGTLNLGQGTHGEINSYYGYSANANQTSVLQGGSCYLVVNGEYTTVYGSFNINSQQFDLQAGTSTIELTNPYAGISGYLTGLSFYNVSFTNSNGTGIIANTFYNYSNQPKPEWSFHKLSFAGDGIIYGPSATDSLLFTPGHGYVLESNLQHKINDYWQIRGNNCARIRLESTLPGQQAINVKTSGIVDGAFIQMRDQKAQGGAQFFAGANSNNVGNSNTGWQFDDKPGFVDYGLLGEDVVLCNNTSLTLNEDNLIGANAYLWNNSGTDYYYEVTTPGQYFVQATYDNNCILYDTIAVLAAQQFQVDLGADQTICEGETITLDGTVPLNGVTYSWENGSTDPMLTTDTSGQYILAATLTGCVSRDTIGVQVIALPDLMVGAQSQQCEGDTLQLDVTLPGASYLWSDQSTQPQLAITRDGTYWIRLTKDGCVAADTFSVAFIAPPVISLPDTAQLCEGEAVTLDATVPSATYLWSTGETSAMLPISPTTSTTIGVQVSFGSCASTDSIFVRVQPRPELELPPDQPICPGVNLQIVALTDAVSVLWNTGDTTQNIVVTQPGTYTATVSIAGCTRSESTTFSAVQSAFAGLGPDTTICDDVTIDLNATTPGATYLWSTGSTQPLLEVGDAGTYVVLVDDGQCLYRDSVTIQERHCVYFDAFMPNTFSPNGDGRNDEYKVFLPDDINIISFTMQIYNRWGDVLFETSDPSAGWDGTKNGQSLPTDVYIARISIQYRDDNGPGNYQQGGDVLLVR